MPSSNIPCDYTAGDTTTWTDTLPGYDASDPNVAVVYRFGGPDQFTVTGAGNGTNWVFTMPTTKTYGIYGWQQVGTATDNSVSTLNQGRLTYRPNFATPPNETPAALTLAAANTALQSIITGKATSASVAGESWTRHNITELENLIQKLQAQVYREQELYNAMLGIQRDRNIESIFTLGGTWPGPFPVAADYYWSR